MPPANCPECGDEVPRSRGTRPKIFCCTEHKNKFHNRKAYLRRLKAKGRKAKQVLGRKCKWCKRLDSYPAQWSPKQDECARCRRTRQRSPCGICGGPFWPSRGGCPSCNDLTTFEKMELTHLKKQKQAS